PWLRRRATTSSMSSTANMMRRMPSVFAGALSGSALTASGVWNLVSSTPLWPSGGRVMAMAARTSLLALRPAYTDGRHHAERHRTRVVSRAPSPHESGWRSASGGKYVTYGWTKRPRQHGSLAEPASSRLARYLCHPAYVDADCRE